ncbi:hypothetical protein HMF3257_01375 [Spirosoma telluris]|uniref:Uncharacterized protein n=2 Tax=Spirosoma telluris TaxID=2183553 RepID=A0A327NGK4_9BACT|nr:hypothetical protein HMF3257_01375 [Spirosoma telluris]
MVNDVVGPCGAARYYTYANLAAYEFMYQAKHPSSYLSFSGFLHDYPTIKLANPDSLIDVEFGCVYVLLRVGEAMLPSGYLLEKTRNQFVTNALTHRHLSAEQIKATQDHADGIAKQIVRYAASDGYIKTSGYPRYTPI